MPAMTERITPRQFHEAAGVEDWRVLGEGACTYFRTGSFAAGARLVHAIRELVGLDDHHPDVDLRYGGDRAADHDHARPLRAERTRRRAGPADLGGGAPGPQRNRIHLDVWVPHDQAEARIAAAIAAGGHLVTDQQAPSWWVLADAEGNEACVATWMGRD
jgi:4a-hydroxytetrahydrobiopterin dehydratase